MKLVWSFTFCVLAPAVVHGLQTKTKAFHSINPMHTNRKASLQMQTSYLGDLGGFTNSNDNAASEDRVSEPVVDDLQRQIDSCNLPIELQEKQFVAETMLKLGEFAEYFLAREKKRPVFKLIKNERSSGRDVIVGQNVMQSLEGTHLKSLLDEWAFILDPKIIFRNTETGDQSEKRIEHAEGSFGESFCDRSFSVAEKERRLMNALSDDDSKSMNLFARVKFLIQDLKVLLSETTDSNQQEWYRGDIEEISDIAKELHNFVIYKDHFGDKLRVFQQELRDSKATLADDKKKVKRGLLASSIVKNMKNLYSPLSTGSNLAVSSGSISGDSNNRVRDDSLTASLDVFNSNVKIAPRSGREQRTRKRSQSQIVDILQAKKENESVNSTKRRNSSGRVEKIQEESRRRSSNGGRANSPV